MKICPYLVIALFVLSACGANDPVERREDGGASGADGGGVCCPLTASPGCSPAGYFGGWAPSMDACMPSSANDGCPFTLGEDAHGCDVLVDHGFECEHACGAVRPDASVPDASAGH